MAGRITIIETAGAPGGASLTSALTSDYTLGGIARGEVYPAGTPLETILRDLLVRRNGRIFGCKLETPASVVLTGLTMDYSYTFRVRGRVPADVQATLVGAYTSNAERATLRLMGGANKAQGMWPGNVEVTSTASGIDYRRAFACEINASGMTFAQGETTFVQAFTGTATGTGAAPICLLNERDGDVRGNGVLCEAEILDGAGVTLRHIFPWYLNGEIVLVDEANNNQVYRPSAGALVEVTA